MPQVVTTVINTREVFSSAGCSLTGVMGELAESRARRGLLPLVRAEKLAPFPAGWVSDPKSQLGNLDQKFFDMKHHFVSFFFVVFKKGNISVHKYLSISPEQLDADNFLSAYIYFPLHVAIPLHTIYLLCKMLHSI